SPSREKEMLRDRADPGEGGHGEGERGEIAGAIVWARVAGPRRLRDREGERDGGHHRQEPPRAPAERGGDAGAGERERGEPDQRAREARARHEPEVEEPRRREP